MINYLLYVTNVEITKVFPEVMERMGPGYIILILIYARNKIKRTTVINIRFLGYRVLRHNVPARTTGSVDIIF